MPQINVEPAALGEAGAGSARVAWMFGGNPSGRILCDASDTCPESRVCQASAEVGPILTTAIQNGSAIVNDFAVRLQATGTTYMNTDQTLARSLGSN
jgi:hypothetical protein